MPTRKKKVLLVTSNFSPEDSGIAVYSTDLVMNILSSKYEVNVITTLPHYPWWRIPEHLADIEEGNSKLGGVDITRMSHYIPKKSNALGRARMEFSIWNNGRKLVKRMNDSKFDLVIAVMPSVSSGLIAKQVAEKLKIQGIVIFQDISSLGVLESQLPGSRYLYRVAKFLESRASSWASSVIVVSNSMTQHVAKLTKGKSHLETIYNYSLLEMPSISQAEAQAQLGENKNIFTVLHSGNMGHKQDLLNVVNAARILIDHKDIKFLFVGHGSQEENLRYASRNLGNVEFRPFYSKADFPKVLASADVLLLNESASLREMSLPSKLTSYFSSERPVIAAVSNKSATSKLLTGNAYIVEPARPEVLAEAILELRNNPELRKILGMKGREFSIDKFSPESGRLKYFNLIAKYLD